MTLLGEGKSLTDMPYEALCVIVEHIRGDDYWLDALRLSRTCRLLRRATHHTFRAVIDMSQAPFQPQKWPPHDAAWPHVKAHNIGTFKIRNWAYTALNGGLNHTAMECIVRRYHNFSIDCHIHLKDSLLPYIVRFNKVTLGSFTKQIDITIICKAMNDPGATVKELIIGINIIHSSRWLPEDIGGAHSLRTLRIHDSFMLLPDTIGQLTQLRVLEIYNRYTLLSSTIGNLKGLRELDISESCYHRLPNNIGNLLNLEILNLCRCYHLIELPESITQLKKLKHLDISHCRKLNLEDLPVGLNDMDSITSIYHSMGNLLERFPAFKGRDVFCLGYLT